MTDYARFSELSQPAGVTWSVDRFTATFDGVSIYNTWVASKLTTGKYVFCMTYGSACTSGISDTGDLSGDNVVNGVYLRENGDLNTVTAGGATTITNISGTTSGSTAMWAFDAGSKLAWVTIDGTNWYGAAGTALPTSLVVAGTGGISLSMITAGANPLSHLYSGSGTVVLNSGASSYPWAAPSGFSSLPATLDVQQLILGQTGDAVSFTWQSNNAGGLEYSTDGGSTWTACGGTTTGSSGTATLAAFGSAGASKVIIRDATVTTDQVVTPVFILDALPSGTGSLLASFVGQFPLSDGDSSHPTLTTSFSPSESIVYALSIGVSHNGAGAVGGSASLRIQNDEAAGKGALFDNQSVFSSSGVGSASTWTGITPDTGSQYVTITDYSQQVGTITMTEPGTLPNVPIVNAEISNNGTVATFVNRTDTSSDNWPVPYDFMSLVFNTSFINETFLYALAVWEAAAPESLTLTSASTPSGGGTLSIVGTVTNGTPSNVDISTTGTAGTFSAAGSYSLTSGTIHASNGPLSPGTYSVAMRDHDNPSVISNALSLVVSLESLLLETASAVPGGTLTVGGVVFNGTPTNLDISTDGGATWAENTAYSLSAGTFTASGGTLTAGTYPVVVRDHDLPSVVSNTETLFLSSESLTLTSAGGIIGSNLTFAGVSNNGPPSAIDVSLNGTWSLASELVSGGGTVNVPYSGNGPIIPSAGTYTVQTRDHGYPYVLSNTLTVALSTTETLHLSSATGTFGGVLALAGTSAGATPAGLNVSLDGGTTYGPTSGYSNVSGSWTASSGFTLTAGVFVVQVQDSVNLGVVSNAITLTIDAPTETILLESAAGVAGAFLGLSGVTSNGPAAALNFTLDDGATWAPTTSYDSTGNTLSDPWTANGTPLSPGGYVVRVQDADNLGVISNPITLVVPPPSSGGGTTTTNTSFGISPNGRTIFLNPATWDWVLDTDGNIAVANDPYATAQDVSSACRLFLGECWYNTTAGVPYFGDILGKSPSIPYLTAQLEKAALSVPTVVKAKAVITGLQGRAITGQVQITQANGTSQTVTI